jgi:tetratricopeptide (TPR) repeat protein
MRKFYIALIFAASSLVTASAQGPEEPFNFEKAYIKALGQMLSGQTPKAIEAFDALAKKEPENAEVCYQLARLYETEKNQQKAIDYANKAVKLDVKNTWYRVVLADMYEDAGRFGDAAAQYKMIVASGPFNTNSYISYGYFLVKAGQFSKALEVYKEIEKNIGISQEVTFNKYKIYDELGKKPEAIIELRQLIKLLPYEIEPKILLAGIFESSGDLAGATMIYEELFKQDPSNDEVAQWLFEHQAKTATGTPDIAGIKQFLATPNATLEAVLPTLGEILTAQIAQPGSKPTEEFKVLSKDIVKQFPKHPAAHALYGDIMFYNQQWSEAATAYRASVALDGRTRMVWEQLLYTEFVQQQWTDLVKDGEKAMDRFPNSGSVAYLAGMGYLMTNDLATAEDYLNQAGLVGSKDQALSAAVLTAKGRLQYQKKDYPQAVSLLQKAIDSKLAPVEAYDYLGDVYAAQGDNAAATKQWQLALEKGSLNPEIPKKLANK